MGWVFFRARDLSAAWGYFGDLFGLRRMEPGAGLVGGLLFQPWLFCVMGVAAVVVWGCPQTWDWTRRLTLGKALACLALGALACVVLATQEYNPFIYFIF